MIFSDLIQDNKEEFIQKNKLIALYMGINENFAPMVFWLESRLNPKAVNKQPGDPSDPYTRAAIRATGIFQCMPSTAVGLGTSTQAIFNSNSYDQLTLYFKMIMPYRGKIKTFWDLYLLNFFPLGMGMPDDWVFHSSKLSASSIATQNPGFDLNKDGMITIAEFKQAVMKLLPAAALSFVTAEVKKNALPVIGFIISGILLGFILSNKKKK